MRRIQVRKNYGKTNPRATAPRASARPVRQSAKPGGHEWAGREALRAGRPVRQPAYQREACSSIGEAGRAQAGRSAKSGGRKRAGARDEAERGALIVKYSPLVKFLANRMAMRLPPSVSVDDLISAGIMGLLDAIEKFDPGKEVQFKTYAEFRIRGAILDELRSMDWIPRSIRRKVREIEHAIIAAERKLGRPAEDSEIAKQMGIDLDTYYDILDKARGIDLLSFDEYVDSHRDDFESKKSFKSLMRGNYDPVDYIIIQERKEVIADGIKALPEKEQMVVSLYYYKDLTLKEIGEVMGLTESRISQIHTKAIIKLRTRLRSYSEK